MRHTTSLKLSGILALVALNACTDNTPTQPHDVSGPAMSPQVAAAPLSFYQVSAGSNRSCGVTMDSRLYCWGDGPLGDGTNARHLTPVAIAGALRFSSVSAGNYYACAVTIDHQAYCWGANYDGRLGDGTTTDRLNPVRVAGGLRFRLVNTGPWHSCGVTYP